MFSTIVLIYLAISIPLIVLLWAALIAARQSDLERERNLRATVFRVYSDRRK